MSLQGIKLDEVKTTILKRTGKTTAHQRLVTPGKSCGCGQVVVREQIKSASKNGCRKQECKLSNVEKYGSRAVDQ